LGCNKLIQQGAKPALASGDILEELGLPGATQGAAEGGLPGRTPPPDLSALQRSLWETLRSEPRHVDVLVATAGAETSAVLTALTELEMRGVGAGVGELAAVRPGDSGRRPGDFGGESLDTLYLGGGTPSLLPPDAISALLTSLRDAFHVTSSRDAVEVTLEANPEDVTPDSA